MKHLLVSLKPRQSAFECVADFMKGLGTWENVGFLRPPLKALEVLCTCFASPCDND